MGVYVVSTIVSAVMVGYAIDSPPTIPFGVMLKMLSIPAIYHLNQSFNKGLGIYFYLNLGISRKEYLFIPFIIDFILFVVLIIIAGIIGYAIN